MPRSGSNNDSKFARLVEHQRALAAFSRVASEPTPRERLLHHACTQAARVTHIRHAKVLQYRATEGHLLVVAGVGWKPGVVGAATLGADNFSPPGRALQTAAPVRVEDLPNDPEFRLSPLLRDHNIVSLLNVPVMTDGRTWGVFEVDAEHQRAFDEIDVGFLTTMANMIGSAILRDEAERRALGVQQERAKAEAIWKSRVRELQHRTKNNLQTIVSFLALQRRTAETADSRRRIGSVMDRVQAIALAHDQLFLRENASQVEFGGYLRSLCANIVPQNDSVSLDVHAAEATMPLDQAVPAGLIVNELVTNALKYAFDEGQNGRIRVSFTTDADAGEVCIEVEDNGKGMGPPRAGGLGLTLIEAFVQQLAGRIERDAPERGTRARIWFPLVQ